LSDTIRSNLRHFKYTIVQYNIFYIITKICWQFEQFQCQICTFHLFYGKWELCYIFIDMSVVANCMFPSSTEQERLPKECVNTLFLMNDNKDWTVITKTYWRQCFVLQTNQNAKKMILLRRHESIFKKISIEHVTV
jgi:hypothetical protein